MRSPYQTPKDPPAQRFLRLPPREKSRKGKAIAIGAGLLLGYLVYSFVGTDSGLIGIRSLEHETRELARRKADLETRAAQAEKSRKSFVRDPLLDERVARERFHMVKKDEIIYRYEAEEDSAR